MVPKLNLVVAACQSSKGIGFNGTLPWRIPGDMAFFKQITSTTLDSGKQNAVIMGRKTWDSIPSKFRPLTNRVNIVISNTVQSLPGALVAKSLDEAVCLASSSDLSERVENIFVIGGSSIYTIALQSPHCHRIYLTEVLKEFNCDTFLPQFDTNKFKQIKLPGIPGNVQEGDIPYKISVFQRTRTENLDSISTDSKPFPFVCISVAMDVNRGFGMNGRLPWSPIKKDYDHYTSLLVSSNPEKKVVSITGRKTWESMTEEERRLPSTFHIVVSMSAEFEPENVHFLAESFEEALQTGIELCHEGKAEKICVMGGRSIYQKAIESPFCQRIFMTKILQKFECDVFFPQFEHLFKLAKSTIKNEDPNKILEENDIQFKFEEYERCF